MKKKIIKSEYLDKMFRFMYNNPDWSTLEYHYDYHCVFGAENNWYTAHDRAGDKLLFRCETKFD